MHSRLGWFCATAARLSYFRRSAALGFGVSAAIRAILERRGLSRAGSNLLSDPLHKRFEKGLVRLNWAHPPIGGGRDFMDALHLGGGRCRQECRAFYKNILRFSA